MEAERPDLWAKDLLRQMYRRADVELRKHQLEMLEAMSLMGAVVYVARVGGGKTDAYTLPAYRQLDGITVVIQPLRALMDDTAARLRAWGIKTAVWDGDKPEGNVSVVLVTPEGMGSNT